MAFCDFCDCSECKDGSGPRALHAPTSDGRWICDVCWKYDVCVREKRKSGIVDGPCEDENGVTISDCEHRPKLVGLFVKREVEMTLADALSHVVHDMWSSWMKYVFENCGTDNSDGSFTISPEKVERWKRQMSTRYEDLSESEKSSDRWVASQYEQRVVEFLTNSRNKK